MCVQLIETAETNGGGFVWAPAATLRINGFAFSRVDWKLYCGTEFVETAEKDIGRIWGSVAHEMAGHVQYGKEALGADIMTGAVAGMSSENAAGATGGNSIKSGYGYMETELFAELYEASHEDEDNPTDRPFEVGVRELPGGGVRYRMADVQAQLEGIRSAFEPSIATGLIRSVALRVELDGFIKPEVKARFRHFVTVLFGDILPSWSAPPEAQL